MFHNRRQLIAASRRPFVASAGAWTPASVSTAFWFDADDAATITASGGLVSQWNDKSGNARHMVQATSAQQFTDTASVQNSKHGLLSSYSANSYMATASFTLNQPFIVVVAFQLLTDYSNWGVAFDGNVAGSGVRAYIQSNYGDGVHSVGAGATTDIAAEVYTFPYENHPNPYYITAVFNGASSEVRQNGVRIASGNVGSGGITEAVLCSTNAPQSLPGYFLEAFCIPGSSTTDVANAETYIADKWDIHGPTIDGCAAGSTAAGTTVTATLSTSKPNDIIFASFKYDAGTVASVSDTAGLTWTLLASHTANGHPLAVYYAKSASILTSDVITVTISTSTLVEIHAFAVSGANFTTPFDSDAALPAINGTGGSFVDFTTSNANDILIACYRHTSSGPCIGLAGWGTVRGNEPNMLTLFKTVTAIQSTVSAIGTMGGTQQTSIGTALVRAP